jgi:tetratricopeptide (TPR) repeat protein
MSLLLIACDDYVDIVPRGAAMAESADDIDNLLNEVRGLSVMTSVIPLFLSDNIKITSENLQTLNSSSDAKLRGIANVYLLKDLFYDELSDDQDWIECYKIIAKLNFILNASEQVSGDENRINSYKGEALTKRAMMYFYLVNIYGEHYGLPKAKEQNSGVPILTEYANLELPLHRRTVNEVYEMILQDLKMAEEYTLDRATQRYRVNKGAVRGLLARVYLHMGNQAKALEYANKALSSNSQLIDHTELETQPFLPNEETLLFNMTRMEKAGAGFFAAPLGVFSDDLVGLYDDKSNDWRISVMMDMDFNGDFVYANGYGKTNELRLGITVPELMLIKAELLARDNQFEEAMAVVNELRKTRFLEPAVQSESYKLTATDKNDAIQKVLDERRREFHLSGLRFFDIKRLNALYNGNISLTRGEVTWEPNSINWAVPIGDKLIKESEGEIVQNPRE